MQCFESVRLHNALTKVVFIRELEFKFPNTPDISLDLKWLCNYEKLDFPPRWEIIVANANVD